MKDLRPSPFSTILAPGSLPPGGLQQIENDMRARMNELGEAFSKKGYEVNPAQEKSWLRLRELPLKDVRDLYVRFRTYHEIYMSVLTQGGNPNEDSRLLWAAIKRLGLRPCSDFFEHVRESDIVEFYNSSGVQIFHNINFFDVCSYNFAEIFTYPFSELWERKPEDEAEINELAYQGFTGKFAGTVNSTIREHVLKENFSEGRHIVNLQITKYAPLYGRRGEVAALAVVSTGEVTGTVPEEGLRRLTLVPGPEQESEQPDTLA